MLSGRRRLTMTAPIWMAYPPEVHSASLSSGPGPSSLLVAAGAWNALSAEYASVADELGAVLAGVQAGLWEGPSAEQYVAAHVPYLAWLMLASANSAAAAAAHEIAAAAYTTALAAMPTLVELSANHAVHGVLVATNFFGINMIPIALNEADYARMWIQAATTMTTYQTVSSVAAGSTPQTTPAPQIVKAPGSSSAQTGAAQAAQPGASTGLGDELADLVQRLGVSPEIVDEYGIDNIYDFLNNPISYTETHLISRLLTDPLALLENPLYVFFDGDEVFFPLGYAISPATAGLAVASVGSLGGLAGLAGLSAVAPAPTAVAPALPLAQAAPEMLPAAGMAPTAPVAAAATVPAPTSAPATSTVASPASPPMSAPATGGAGFGSPYIVGGPGVGFDSGMSAFAIAKRTAPEPNTAAATVASAAREQARARRRRRAKLPDYGDQFMDMDVEVDPDWGAPPDVQAVAATAVSDQRAGLLGFVGTVRKHTVAEAAGLTTLGGDEFGGGPRMPLLPDTWEAQRDQK